MMCTAIIPRFCAGRCATEVSNETLSWPATVAGTTAQSVQRCPLMTHNGTSANHFSFETKCISEKSQLLNVSTSVYSARRQETARF